MYAALNTNPSTGFRPGVGMSGLGYAAGGSGPRGGNQGWNPTLAGYEADEGGWHLLRGLGTLGAISSDNAAQLVADGCDAGDVQLASSLGATDADAEYILSLNDSDAEESALLKLISTLNDAAAGAAIAASEAAGTPSGTTTAAVGQSPAGSTLLYTATFNASGTLADPLEGLLSTPSQVVAAMAQYLQGTGLSISSTQSSSYTGNSFTVTVTDSIGHALLSDAQSVLDHALTSINGVKKVSSSIQIGSLGSGVPGAVPAALPATNITSWLESNAAFIGLGLAGIFVLPALITSFRK